MNLEDKTICCLFEWDGQDSRHPWALRKTLDGDEFGSCDLGEWMFTKPNGDDSVLVPIPGRLVVMWTVSAGISLRSLHLPKGGIALDMDEIFEHIRGSARFLWFQGGSDVYWRSQDVVLKCLNRMQK